MCFFWWSEVGNWNLKKNPLLNRVDINFFVKDSCRHSFPFWMSRRATVEYRITEEEPFSVTNVYKYNKHSDDPENSSTWSLLGQMIPKRMSSRCIHTRSLGALLSEYSQAPSALLTTGFNFFLDYRTMANVFKTIISSMVNAYNQSIIWKVVKK